jgi:hypothetical protein
VIVLFEWGLSAAARPSLPRPPLSQPHSHPTGREEGFKDLVFSLLSRRAGVRLGEEGRGGEAGRRGIGPLYETLGIG